MVGWWLVVTTYMGTRQDSLKTAEEVSELPTKFYFVCLFSAYVDIEPWWRVDLQKEYKVKMIRMWNYIDDTRKYL